MDISSILGTLLGSDSTQGIGQATKTDSKTVKNVLAAAIPALLNGAKTQSEDTSTGFADALISHGQDDTSDIGKFLGGIDLKDGGKIISHLLGKDSDTQVSEIASSAGASKKDTKNILSAAAPLLMSLLGKQSASNADSSSDNNSSAIGAAAQMLLSNVDVGSLLGSLLGGGDNAQSDGKKKTGLLGSLLGKLLK